MPCSRYRSRRSRCRSPWGERGQASVELVALLPILAAVVALAWECVLAGQAIWESGGAARAAARAEALGQDPADAARGALPAGLARDVSVSADGDGAVTVALPIRLPSVLGGERLTTIHARARLAPQTG